MSTTQFTISPSEQPNYCTVTHSTLCQLDQNPELKEYMVEPPMNARLSSGGTLEHQRPTIGIFKI